MLLCLINYSINDQLFIIETNQNLPLKRSLVNLVVVPEPHGGRIVLDFQLCNFFIPVASNSNELGQR